jgi:hypothetical protein
VAARALTVLGRGIARAARAARLDLWLAPLAPALLAGAHLTGLLFFLNPRVPISVGALARGTAVYGSMFALPSVAAHLWLARRRGLSVLRLLPWSATLVIVAGALGDWVHASVYSYFLPGGIDVQLIKTALWLSLGGVLLFYTSLLHTIHHRGYGLRSRALVLLVALGTVYAMFDRRSSFRPPEPRPPRLVSVEPEAEPHVVVIALAAATLDSLLPLSEQGKLPAFAALFDNGAATRLSGFGPVSPPALWASWATGKLPYEHGLTGAHAYSSGALGLAAPLRLLPLALGFEHWGLPGGRARDLTLADRGALPVWEVLARAGRHTLVGGFGGPLTGGSERLEPLPGPLAPLRAEDALWESDWVDLARGLGADRRWLAALRARLAAPEPPVASFVRLDGLETASLEAYGGFERAEFEGSRSGAARRAADAYSTYVAGLDVELGALWDAIPPPRLLIVSSAYGVASPTGFARVWREMVAAHRSTGTLSGPPDGVFLMRGENVRLGVHLPDARILDLTPTLLYALDLPIARDLDGRVLTEAFDPALLQQRALSFVPSYESLPPYPAAAGSVSAPPSPAP